MKKSCSVVCESVDSTTNRPMITLKCVCVLITTKDEIQLLLLSLSWSYFGSWCMCNQAFCSNFSKTFKQSLSLQSFISSTERLNVFWNVGWIASCSLVEESQEWWTDRQATVWMSLKTSGSFNSCDKCLQVLIYSYIMSMQMMAIKTWW